MVASRADQFLSGVILLETPAAFSLLGGILKLKLGGEWRPSDPLVEGDSEGTGWAGLGLVEGVLLLVALEALGVDFGDGVDFFVLGGKRGKRAGK